MFHSGKYIKNLNIQSRSFKNHVLKHERSTMIICLTHKLLQFQVSRNNAKSTISELEFQLEQLRQEKTALQGELQTLQENTSELQIQVQVATDEKLALMSRAGEALARSADLERQLQEAWARNTQLARDRERDVSY